MRPALIPELSSGFSPAAVALTIAGFDPSSGAGVTADLAVFAAHGIYGTSAIAAMTVQSTMGVAAVRAADPVWLLRTIEHLSADLPPAGMKIGMLGSDGVVRAVVSLLQSAPTGVPVVLDPVLRSSSGQELLESQAVRRMQTELLPLVRWVTPNWVELSVLAGLPVRTLEQAKEAADAVGRRHPGLHIVATGGDQNEPTDLLRVPGGAVQVFCGERIATTATHGTGCAFSSALLSRLILGDAPATAVSRAKAYVTEGLRSAPRLGHGRGPLNLLWPLRRDGRKGC